MLKAMETAKLLNADASKIVPGGKLVASYKARGQSMVVCIWDVPSMDALAPLLEQMNFAQWETEVIPVEKTSDFLPKAEKILAEMVGS
jgi:hypothetical protein